MRDDYLERDAIGLAQWVASKEVSADEVLDIALSLVQERNPPLNAVVHQQEDRAREAIKAGLPEGPLKGVPFLLKDLGAEARAFPTSNGSRLSKGMRWSYDSEIYLRFQRAGLVTFGRTTSPEAGIGAVTEPQVNEAPTRNPWNTQHTSGGSSGGAGAVVASGILPVAHGSDGGGSVRIPAASCGLVGLKPTRARTPDGPASGEGWAGMATDGVLTRSLRDTAVLFDAMSGIDLGAPYAAPAMPMSFVQALDTPPKRLRVRVATQTLAGSEIDAECAQAALSCAKLLEDLGHHVEPYQPDPDLATERMMRAWTDVVACGTENAMRAKFEAAGADPALLDGVTRGAMALAQGISGAQYLAAVEEIHAFGRRMARYFQDVDVLVTPTLAQPPARVGRFKPVNDDFLNYRNGPDGVFAYSPFTALFNASGQPAISLPLHWTRDGLPVGVHLAMRYGEDAELMSLASEIEQAAPWRAKQQELISQGGVRVRH